jgi:hypothetical protein
MLKFSVGDVIHVVEAMDGWYKAVHFDTKETGLFPASFFRTKPSEEGKDPVMRELHNVFREWGDLLKKLYLVRCEVLALVVWWHQRQLTTTSPVTRAASTKSSTSSRSVSRPSSRGTKHSPRHTLLLYAPSAQAFPGSALACELTCAITGRVSQDEVQGDGQHRGGTPVDGA